MENETFEQGLDRLNAEVKILALLQDHPEQEGMAFMHHMTEVEGVGLGTLSMAMTSLIMQRLVTVDDDLYIRPFKPRA